MVYKIYKIVNRNLPYEYVAYTRQKHLSTVLARQKNSFRYGRSQNELVKLMCENNINFVEIVKIRECDTEEQAHEILTNYKGGNVEFVTVGRRKTSGINLDCKSKEYQQEYYKLYRDKKLAYQHEYNKIHRNKNLN